MTKMNSQHRSLSAALDMVEAAISSLENQAKQAKLFQEQQKQQDSIAAAAAAAAALRTTAPVQFLPHHHVSDRFSAKLHEYHEEPEDLPNLNGKVEDMKPMRTVEPNNQQNNHVSKSETSREGDSKQTNGHQVLDNSLHKRHKTEKKSRSVLPGVLLPHRSSTPRKKSHKRSSSSKHHRSSSSSRRERNNNISSERGDDELNSASEPPLHKKHKHSSSSKTAGYSQPTLSSRMKEQLTEKPKKKEKEIMPFVPAGSQGKSYHVGVIIQKELGQLKSQPLEVWAAAKHNAAKREASSNEAAGNIMQRELTKA